MIIFPKDLLRIPDLRISSERSARYHYAKMKDHYGKKKRSERLTAAEIAEWIGEKEDKIIQIVTKTAKSG